MRQIIIMWIGLQMVLPAAYIYWRMLSKSPDMACKVVFATLPPISNDDNSPDAQTLDQLIGA